MKFLSTFWLWALLALPAIYLLVARDERQRASALGKFADPSLWKALAPEMNPGARLRKARVWLLSIAFVFLALARPQWGTHEEEVKATGLDVMLVLDVSNSMEVEDIVPNRLQKAKHLIRTLVDRLEGDRIGLVAFAASASVSCPLTTDLNYVLETVQIMGPKMVPNQGTDIGLALDTARKSLDRGAEEEQAATGAAPKASRVIVLVSDGEDQEDSASQAAKKLKESGIRFYAIGVGSEKGGPIPVRDETVNLVGYKRDRQNQAILSTFKPAALTQLAADAGGRYFNASFNETEADEILRDMGALQRGEFADRKIIVYEDRFQYPLALAVVLMLIEWAIPLRKLGFASALLLGFGFSALSRPAQAATPLDAYLENEKGLQAFKQGKIDEAKKDFGHAQALDPSQPELEYNDGVVELQQGDMDRAIQSFQSSIQKSLNKDPRLAARSLFNLGLAQSKKGDTGAAVRAYLGAIGQAQQGKDVDLEAQARKNIELLIQQQQQQKQQQKQDQKQDQKQKQDQQKQDQQKQDKQQPQNDQNNKNDKKEPDQKADKEDKKPPEQPKQYRQNQKHKFESPKLSPEDAERVMSELTNREKDLQAKLKKKNATPNSRTQNDW